MIIACINLLFDLKAVPIEEEPRKFYPTYMSGLFYVMDAIVRDKILKVAERGRMILVVDCLFKNKIQRNGFDEIFL